MSPSSTAATLSGQSTTPLLGSRILLVEDDYLLAADLSDFLADHGATVLGPAPTPFYALSLLGRRGADAAVLDVRLHGTDVFEVAAELARRRIPMVFATAMAAQQLPAAYRDYPVLQKPFVPARLLDSLAAELNRPAAPLAFREPGARKDDQLMRAVIRALRLR